MASTRSILIIEDDAGIRESMADCLQFEGYEVVGAANGEEALRMLRSEPRPGLIILDLLMPVMSGRQFLEKMRADGALANIPVVVTTAATATNANLAVAAHLPKPFELEELLQMVARFVGPPSATP